MVFRQHKVEVSIIVQHLTLANGSGDGESDVGKRPCKNLKVSNYSISYRKVLIPVGQYLRVKSYRKVLQPVGQYLRMMKSYRNVLQPVG